MKKPILALAALTAIMTACNTAEHTPDYTFTATVDPSANGSRAYLVNYDTNEPIDSADVTEGTVLFDGRVDTPVMARLVIGGKRGPIFVLEPGNITMDSVAGEPLGTPLNDQLYQWEQQQNAIVSESRELPEDSVGKARLDELQGRYEALNDSMLNANAANPIGYYLFMQKAYGMDLAQLDAAIAATPSLGNYQRVSKLRESLAKKAETSEGKPFKDFEITYDGTTQKLSDYVGKGKYTLVDFWASWCGPCIRETTTIKDLYNRYGQKGLDVLGVAVWDKPDDTLKAIEAHSLPWPQIIDAQSIPTDMYGISSIPTIILFDPQGNIVSRGKQGAELVSVVEAAMADYKPAE